MNIFRKSTLLIHEIGLPSLAAYGNYALHKRLGSYQSARLTKNQQFSSELEKGKFIQPVSFNFTNGSQTQVSPFGSSDELIQRVFHPFCGEPARLDFALPQPLKDWTEYADAIAGRDIKHFWEPARFSWALQLARDFAETGKEENIECFWKNFEDFISNNPCYLGPNWISAQEVALRAINWLLLIPSLVASTSATKARRDALISAIWQHFLRIPLTIDYAKAQNNNHLLSESLALYLLGSFFAPQSSYAQKWAKRGLSLFEKSLLAQIAEDGTYCQHSANYHRMMLHLALIYHSSQVHAGRVVPPEVNAGLAKATLWLQLQMDTISGCLPNLGHNDGTLLLPFGCEDFGDYRPTLQAASLAFLGKPALPAGQWDDLAHMLSLDTNSSLIKPVLTSFSTNPRVGTENLWASFRAVQFNERPGHADQLHTEIWWDGINIARDAGTFAYNDPPPWQNALMATRVHNTITVDNQDQMWRAGKFLWLKKARATIISSEKSETISASHDGYKNLGVIHTRTLRDLKENGLAVVDELNIQSKRRTCLFSLHWLLPDWQWKWEDGFFTLQHENRTVELSISCKSLDDSVFPIHQTHLFRAGIPLIGTGQDEIMGWTSPTYGVKIPALSLSLGWLSNRSITVNSTWRFKKGN